MWDVFALRLILCWKVTVSFLAPREPLAPLWVAQLAEPITVTATVLVGQLQLMHDCQGSFEGSSTASIYLILPATSLIIRFITLMLNGMMCVRLFVTL